MLQLVWVTLKIDSQVYKAPIPNSTQSTLGGPINSGLNQAESKSIMPHFLRRPSRILKKAGSQGQKWKKPS